MKKQRKLWDAHWKAAGLDEHRVLYLSRRSTKAHNEQADHTTREEHQITTGGLMSLYAFWCTYRGAAGAAASRQLFVRWLANALPPSCLEKCDMDAVFHMENFGRCRDVGAQMSDVCAHMARLDELLATARGKPCTADLIANLILELHTVFQHCSAKQLMLATLLNLVADAIESNLLVTCNADPLQSNTPIHTGRKLRHDEDIKLAVT